MLLVLLFDMCDAPRNFLPVFDHFYPISPEIFAIVPKFPNLLFQGPPDLDQLGK